MAGRTMILDRCPAPVPRTKAGVVEAFRRDTIIAAAIRVIARRGVEATRVRDVAVEAAVSKGTIYRLAEHGDRMVGRERGVRRSLR